MSVEGIYLWPVSRGEPMIVERATAEAGVGLTGDRSRGKKRQVTVVNADDWADATREAGSDAAPMWRRANVVIRGLRFSSESVGRRLRIGEVVLQIMGETTPCDHMDMVHPGLREALVPGWRGGVHCIIEQGGEIAVGAEVALLD
jgi:MOSC domain-containing protein YiiM